MHLAVPTPDPKLLAPYPEDDTTQTPKRCQSHISHDRGYIAVFDDPRRDELGEAVSP